MVRRIRNQVCWKTSLVARDQGEQFRCDHLGEARVKSLTLSNVHFHAERDHLEDVSFPDRTANGFECIRSFDAANEALGLHIIVITGKPGGGGVCSTVFSALKKFKIKMQCAAKCAAKCAANYSGLRKFLPPFFCDGQQSEGGS